LIAATVEQTPAREAVVQAQLEALPGGGKWVVLLALESVDGRYRVRAQALSKEGQPPRTDVWTYDADSGLRAEPKTTQEDA
jgi:hypothetical protein